MNPPCDAFIPRVDENHTVRWVNRCDQPSVQRVGIFYYCEVHRQEVEELKEAPI